MHATANVNGTVIADASSYEVVEGNIYFPIDSIKDKDQVLTVSDYEYTCPWKGESRYYDVHVDGKTLKNAAWEYPTPSERAKNIKGHVAFDKSQVTTSKE